MKNPEPSINAWIKVQEIWHQYWEDRPEEWKKRFTEEQALIRCARVARIPLEEFKELLTY